MLHHPAFPQRGEVRQRALRALAQRRSLVRAGGDKQIEAARHLLRAVAQNQQRHILAHPQLARPGAQLLQRLGADAARRLVDHPRQRHRIARIMNDAQIGEHILDLLALIETRRADQLVFHMAQHTRLFQRAALRIGAVHHRHIAQPKRAAAHQPFNLIQHIGRLFRLVIGLIDGHGRALAVLGVQPFGRAIAVVGDHRVRHIQNRLRAAVILLQQHHARLRIILTKAHHIAIVRAAKAVDGLILVAHHKQVALTIRLIRQQPQHLILRSVGVLKLIHQ